MHQTIVLRTSYSRDGVGPRYNRDSRGGMENTAGSCLADVCTSVIRGTSIEGTYNYGSRLRPIPRMCVVRVDGVAALLNGIAVTT